MSANRSNTAIPTAIAEPIDDQRIDVASYVAQPTAVTCTSSLRQDAFDSGHTTSTHDTTGVTLVDAQPVSNGVIQSICIDHHRAAFLSVTLCKKPAKLGLSMKTNDDGKVYISSLQPDSLLVDSPLQVGDILLSINAKCCKTTRQVGDLLHSWRGSSLTIVAQNLAGDPFLVESMVEKPTPESLVGIAAKRCRSGVQISKIDQNGLLAGSLLNIGDKILSINAVDCQNAQTVTAMAAIQSSPRYVTILARTSTSTGVVLQEESFREREKSAPKGNAFVALDGVIAVFECLAYLSMSG